MLDHIRYGFLLKYVSGPNSMFYKLRKCPRLVMKIRDFHLRNLLVHPALCLFDFA